MAKRGKYAHVTATLPRLNKVEPERQDIVNSVKGEILSPPTQEYPASFVMDTLDEMDENAKDLIKFLKTVTLGKRYASSVGSGYVLARLILDKMEEWRGSLQIVLDAYEGLTTEQMEVEGVTSLKMADGSSLSSYLEPYATVKDQEAFRRWCMQDPDLSKKMSLPWSTTNSLNKERLLAGEEPPPGVETFAKPVLRLTR